MLPSNPLEEALNQTFNGGDPDTQLNTLAQQEYQHPTTHRLMFEHYRPWTPVPSANHQMEARLASNGQPEGWQYAGNGRLPQVMSQAPRISVQQAPVNLQQTVVPNLQTSVPLQQAPVYLQQTPVQRHQAPVPLHIHQAPAPFQHASVPLRQPSISLHEASVPLQQAPVAFQQASAVIPGTPKIMPAHNAPALRAQGHYPNDTNGARQFYNLPGHIMPPQPGPSGQVHQMPQPSYHSLQLRQQGQEFLLQPQDQAPGPSNEAPYHRHPTYKTHPSSRPQPYPARRPQPGSSNQHQYLRSPYYAHHHSGLSDRPQPVSSPPLNGESSQAHLIEASDASPQPAIRELKKRHEFSSEQLRILEEAYSENHYARGKRKEDLAERLGVRPKTISFWFQNKRSRAKETFTMEKRIVARSEEIKKSKP